MKNRLNWLTLSYEQNTKLKIQDRLGEELFNEVHFSLETTL